MIKLPDIYYHGTISIHVPSLMEGIIVDKNKGRPDFGKGFYLTSNLIEAEKWAIRKAGYENTDRTSEEQVVPVILVARIINSDLAKLAGKIFKVPDVIWAEFVYNNRRAEDFFHDFDFVYGPIADGKNKLWPVFEKYKNRKISLEKLVELISPQEGQDQISFNTPIALGYLKVSGIREVRTRWAN
ncbi:MAG: hypothetical protein VR68_14110 [Peptococcaceae bacterium BRH_c4a]|nr:MAG: hypothetical protein VR68_14110 [Peptococcaceae bacterium BRH_c4a]